MGDRLIGLIRSDVEVWAAGIETGRQSLLTPDTSVNSQSAFDRCSRIGLPQEDFDRVVDVEMYLNYLTTQVMPWGDEDFAALRRIIPSLRPAFEALPHKLPSKVWLIQTTGREEAAAAYTKREDTIALPANMVASVHATDAGGDPLHPGFSDDFLAGVITHEFFHLLSKNNPDKRESWYEIVNYRELPNDLQMPDVPFAKGLVREFTMAELKITNPDAPLINVAIELSPGKGMPDVPMAPALLSSEPYTGGPFFNSLMWIFFEVGFDGDKAVIKQGPDGPIWHPATDFMDQYREKVGYYLQGELFHPDELLAQSFAQAAKSFQPPLLDSIAKGLWPKWPN